MGRQKHDQHLYIPQIAISTRDPRRIKQGIQCHHNSHTMVKNSVENGVKNYFFKPHTTRSSQVAQVGVAGFMYSQDTRLDDIGPYLANILMVIGFQHLKVGRWLPFWPKKAGNVLDTNWCWSCFPPIYQLLYYFYICSDCRVNYYVRRCRIY